MERCGVFAIYAPVPYAKCTKDVVKGLQFLQHRGQEGCGIAYYNGEICIKK